MIKVTGSNNKEYLLKDDSKAILLEPREYHDSSIIGYNEKEDRFMYCKQHFMDQLEEQGMTSEEAYEWFYYNTLGTYVSNYPIFLDLEDKTIECFYDYEFINDDWNWEEI